MSFTGRNSWLKFLVELNLYAYDGKEQYEFLQSQIIKSTEIERNLEAKMDATLLNKVLFLKKAKRSKI